MPWTFSANGRSKFESFTKALDAVGIPYQIEFGEEFDSGDIDSDCLCSCDLPDAEGKIDPNRICPCCEGTCEHIKHLRIARFRNVSGKRMVAEEWIPVRSCSVGGESEIDIEVYEEGHRPDIKTRVYLMPPESILPPN